MARVNVEQKALSDPRFGSLGLMLIAEQWDDAPLDYASALGIGLMTKVWNACLESGRYTLTDRELLVLLHHARAAEILIEAGLGERVRRGIVRIRGTEGRTDWLENKRRIGKETGALGAKFGKLGGRPKKPVEPVSENPITGLPENPPPAPAPVPVLTTVVKKNPSDSLSDSQAKPDIDPDVSAAAGEYNRLADEWGKPKITEQRLRALASKLAKVRKEIQRDIPEFTVAEAIRRVREQESFFRDWSSWDLEWFAGSKRGRFNAEKTWNRMYVGSGSMSARASPPLSFQPAPRKDE